MMLIRSYLVEDKEVMVLDGTAGFLPGAAAIRLLTGRQGVGADRVLVFTGTEEIPSFRAYTKEGILEEATAEDYRILANSRPDFEIRLTEHFVSLMRGADEESEAAAC